MKNSNKYLVLFSGGKDSFITAIRLVNEQNKVILLSFNGGSLIAEQNLKYGADRLIARYGNDKVEYAGIYPTAATIAKLNRSWIHRAWKDIGNEYPDLTNCQIQCLHCQTAMWIAAIAYASAKDIKNIASGYKKDDEFCTGLTNYTNSIVDIAKSNFNINIQFPVWDMEDDKCERELELETNGFYPQVLEPKCLIGTSPKNGLCESESHDLMKYFDIELKPHFIDLVNNLIPIFKLLKITDISRSILQYPLIHSENNSLY